MMFDAHKLKIIADKKHPLYDERVDLPLDESVVLSIMMTGVRQPIQVWKDPETGDVIVLDGKQRVKNTLEANKRLKKAGELAKQIPGIALKGNSQHALGTMALLNEGRQDTTPMGKARLGERLMNAGYDETQVGTLLHLKAGTSKNYLALLTCSAVVKSAVDSGNLAPSLAYKLAKLEPADQKKQLAVMLKAAEGVEGHRRRGKKMREATGDTKPKMRSRKEVQSMIQDLIERFGDKAQTTIDLLEWVLGGVDPTVEDAVKTVDPTEDETPVAANGAP
jgi:ParB family chromosome partitioning protein